MFPFARFVFDDCRIEYMYVFRYVSHFALSLRLIGTENCQEGIAESN